MVEVGRLPDGDWSRLDAAPSSVGTLLPPSRAFSSNSGEHDKCKQDGLLLSGLRTRSRGAFFA